MLEFLPWSQQKTLQWIQGLIQAPIPWQCPHPMLTILQCCHRLRLGTEVAVPDVVGRFHTQLVRGEWVQAVGWKSEAKG